MKKLIVLFVVVLMIGSLFNCATPKPAYKTREGKKKLEHYNKLQYGQKV